MNKNRTGSWLGIAVLFAAGFCSRFIHGLLLNCRNCVQSIEVLAVIVAVSLQVSL